MQLEILRTARFEKNLPLLNLINIGPTNGFYVSGFYYGKTTIKNTALNLTFYIPEENMLYLLTNTVIDKTQIQGNCIVVYFKQKYYLLLEGTEEYDVVMENSIEKKTSLTVGKEFIVSGYFKEAFSGNNTGEEETKALVYLGTFQRAVLGSNKPREISSLRFNKRDDFFFFYDKDFDAYYCCVSRNSFILKKETGYKTTMFKNRETFVSNYNERQFFILRQNLEKLVKSDKLMGNTTQFLFSEKNVSYFNYVDYFKQFSFFGLLSDFCKNMKMPIRY